MMHWLASSLATVVVRQADQILGIGKFLTINIHTSVRFCFFIRYTKTLL